MPQRPLILLVEDEEHLAEGLLFNLAAEGYETHHEADGNQALRWLLETKEMPAAVLLDVMLPGRDGFSIVRALRETDIHVPVIMLTARGRSEDVIEGFSAGADDYVAKPFDLEVLIARLASVIRRVRWQSPSVPKEQTPGIDAASEDLCVLGDRAIHFDKLEIHTPEKLIRLTVMEADLLRYLVERAGKIVSRKEILENVWRVHEDTDTRAIDNFIVRLRRYLEPDASKPVHLLTVRGVGYRFMLAEPLDVRDTL